MHGNAFRAFVASVIGLAFLAPAAQADDVLGIVTGPKTGTYYAFGRDIAQAAAKEGLPVEVKPSEGSAENIKRINSSENAALGIVQSDVLRFLALRKNKDSLHIIANLRMVFPLYSEEVHVLARNGIHSFAELQGKKVAIGEENSGSMLTAINLFSLMSITPAESRNIPPAEGVVAVLKGDLDAVILVSGKPVRLFKNLENLSLPENQKYAAVMTQVHFIPLDSPKLLEEYKPAVITKADYNFVQDSVPTIAVQAMLVSYDFSQGNPKRCEELTKLANIIRSALPALKEKGHPKWKEVNLDADSGAWKKDVCAWPGTRVASDNVKPTPVAKKKKK